MKKVCVLLTFLLLMKGFAATTYNISACRGFCWLYLGAPPLHPFGGLGLPGSASTIRRLIW